MRRFILLRLLIAAIMLTVVLSGFAAYACGVSPNSWIECHQWAAVPQFFASNIRGSLFAGFLTLGGFLLSLKTFIVVNIKRDVYDNEKYGEQWHGLKQAGDVTGRRYDPLRDLSFILFVSIVSSVGCAILQLTVGLVPNIVAVLICLFAAAFATTMLISALMKIRENLDIWFEHLGD